MSDKESYAALCFSCNWARIQRSKEAAIKRMRDHHHSGARTLLVSESEVQKVTKLRNGHKIVSDKKPILEETTIDDPVVVSESEQESVRRQVRQLSGAVDSLKRRLGADD